MPTTLLLCAMVALSAVALAPSSASLEEPAAPPTRTVRRAAATATRERFFYTPLVNRSPAELAEYARRLICCSSYVRAVNGTPEILVARPVLATELAPLALPDLRNFDNEPPLVLMIARGNFVDLGDPFGSPTYHYVSYIFDASTGAIMAWTFSRDGAPFRYALNDPSLPESTAVVPATPRPRLPGGIEYVTLDPSLFPGLPWPPTTTPIPTTATATPSPIS